MRFFQGADYHFIERRKTAYVFSAAAPFPDLFEEGGGSDTRMAKKPRGD